MRMRRGFSIGYRYAHMFFQNHARAFSEGSHQRFMRKDVDQARDALAGYAAARPCSRIATLV